MGSTLAKSAAAGPRGLSSSAPAASAAARDAALDPKLVAAAHQFEASLMSELLKPLNSGDVFGGDGGGDDGGGGTGIGADGLAASADGSAGALMGFASEALAKALSDRGGLGIARRVLDHFEAAAKAAAKAGDGAPNRVEKGEKSGARNGSGAAFPNSETARHPLLK